MISRHVMAGPRFVAADPRSAVPDLDVEGADIALVLLDGDVTMISLFSADGAATAAEVILRSLNKLGHHEEARRAVEQAHLDLQGADKPTKVQLPKGKNTIQRAKIL